jgi:hypothetical protein
MLVTFSAWSTGKTNETQYVSDSTTLKTNPMTNREKVVALLKAIEIGATEPVGYINPNKYIQHNLGVADGLAGFGAVLHYQKALQK